MAVVAADKPDYAPGETAHIFASGYQPGEAVQFQVLHNDGTPNTGNGHLPWTVVDGSSADLDGHVDGNVETTWYVNPDDSANSSFELTAVGLTSDQEANNVFTDSEVVAANPSIDISKYVNDANGVPRDADFETGPILAVGSTANFTYTVANTGNVALTNVAVSDDHGLTLTRQTDQVGNNDDTLDVGETWLYTASATVTAGQYTNYGDVTAQDPIGMQVTDRDPAHYFGSSPSIDISKYVNDANGVPRDADFETGPILAVGSTANFTYTVANTGNVALTNVAVSDDHGLTLTRQTDQVGNNDDTLDVGETWLYTASATVTAGQYTNYGDVTAQDPIGMQVTDRDPAHYFGSSPSIDISKYVNDANGVPRDADFETGPILAVGSTANFTYTVANTGNVALTNVAVSDDHGLTLTRQTDQVGNNDDTLDVGETWLYTASATVTAGQYTNYGDVTAQDPIGMQVTDRDPAHYFGSSPSIAIDKTTSGNGGPFADGITVYAGDPIIWRYFVRNTGNVALSNVTVADNQPGVTPVYQSGDSNNNGLLDLTETWTFTASGTAIVGKYSNIGTATGTFTDSAGHKESPSASDSSSYLGECERIVIAPDKQNTSNSLIKVVDVKTGTVVSQFYAYEPNFQGGVRVATADMDGDGIDEIITAPGRGRASGGACVQG